MCTYRNATRAISYSFRTMSLLMAISPAGENEFDGSGAHPLDGPLLLIDDSESKMSCCGCVKRHSLNSSFTLRQSISFDKIDQVINSLKTMQVVKVTR